MSNNQSLSNRQMISAAGTGFEMLKLLLQSLEDHGGSISARKRYLNSPELQIEVAKMIIGGPWKLAEKKIKISVSWKPQFSKLEKIYSERVEVEGGVYRGDDKKNADFLITIGETITQDTTSFRYQLVHAPRLCLNSLLGWMQDHKKELATSRELLYYANKVLYKELPKLIDSFSVSTLGDHSDNYFFPIAYVSKGNKNIKYNGRCQEIPERVVFPENNAFILMRVKK